MVTVTVMETEHYYWPYERQAATRWFRSACCWPAARW